MEKIKENNRGRAHFKWNYEPLVCNINHKELLQKWFPTGILKDLEHLSFRMPLHDFTRVGTS